MAEQRRLEPLRQAGKILVDLLADLCRRQDDTRDLAAINACNTLKEAKRVRSGWLKEDLKTIAPKLLKALDNYKKKLAAVEKTTALNTWQADSLLKDALLEPMPVEELKSEIIALPTLGSLWDEAEQLVEYSMAWTAQPPPSEMLHEEQMETLLASHESTASELSSTTDAPEARTENEANADNRKGPFGLVLNLREWTAKRDKKKASFAGKEYPWKISKLLCRRYQTRTKRDEILEDIWGKGEGSQETVCEHITAIRTIINPLGLKVSNVRKVGYQLADQKAPPKNTKRPSKKPTTRRPR
jgi:DNA-binding winged helix-turn-helix (wHTH) protein